MLAKRWFTCAGNLAATSPGSPCQSTVGSPSNRYDAASQDSDEGDSADTSGAENRICDRRNGGSMASEQMQQLAALFESGRERFSSTNLGLQDVRDICEGLHGASAEPEGVTYAEVDAGGVPALWCIPTECDANSVLRSEEHT